MNENKKSYLPKSAYDTIKEIIKHYALYGNDFTHAKNLVIKGGEKLSETEITRNHSFLRIIGIIESNPKKIYRVTKAGARLGKSYINNNQLTPKIWEELIRKHSLYNEILIVIDENGSIGLDPLKKVIMDKAGYKKVEEKSRMDAYHKYTKSLINIFQEANLIEEKRHEIFTIKHHILKETFISLDRIDDLANIESVFDCSRLIQYCKEINDNNQRGNHAAVGFLSRAIVDHIPPIFNEINFKSVAAHAGEKHASFKKSCERLDKSLKNIVDRSIHHKIDGASIPPFEEEIDFSNDLNTLLARVIEELRKTWKK